MLSITEIRDKTVAPREQIRQTMDAWGKYHPELASADHVPCGITEGLTPANAQQVMESIRAIPLREFLAKSGTTGIAGAAYLVPAKVHDDLIMYAADADICGRIGQVVTGWEGGDLLVDIVSDESYAAHEFRSGGQIATQTVQSMQATIAPKSFGISARITNDLIDDAQFGMVDFHLKNAAVGIGQYASDIALTVLLTATDGWGTLNSSATGDADETRLTNGTTADIGDAVRGNSYDNWKSNTLVITPEAWAHSVSTQAQETGWQLGTTQAGYDYKLGILDVILSNSAKLHASTDVVGAAYTNCISLVFDRNNSMLTGRKRWMQISNYGDPVRDLAGAIVTARQDSVTLYDDCIYKLTET